MTRERIGGVAQINRYLIFTTSSFKSFCNTTRLYGNCSSIKKKEQGPNVTSEPQEKLSQKPVDDRLAGAKIFVIFGSTPNLDLSKNFKNEPSRVLPMILSYAVVVGHTNTYS